MNRTVKRISKPATNGCEIDCIVIVETWLLFGLVPVWRREHFYA